MYVNEIFQSIDGEGARAGSLATFIRLSGCNLRCSYCDTAYALEAKSGKQMAVTEIVDEVDRISIGNLVTLTGGEPLAHDRVYDLINLLIVSGYEVNVETNGSIVPQCSSAPGHLFYTMDMKSPSSGMRDLMSMKAYESLTEYDVLKFVVGSQEDLDDARKLLNSKPTKAQVYFSPVFGQIEAKEIVEYLQQHRMFPCKVQLQLHKFIWDPQERGV